MASNAALPFLMASRQFFEPLDQYRVTETDFLRPVRSRLPLSWECQRSGAWYSCGPRDHRSQSQGWKIHLSATIRDASAVLEAASRVLVRRETPFKFALDRQMLGAMNGKNWSRSGSGKFITAYPQAQDGFRPLCEELASATESFEGPYILSDRRVPGSRTVFYRYGGFAHLRAIRLEGDQVSCISDPSGRLVPDERRPYFVVPTWEQDPFATAVEDDVEGRGLCDGRFAVTSAISFSNSGGVYLATDATSGETVVLKEARPCVDGGSEGYDAVMSLEKEYRLLSRLAGTGIAAEPLAFFGGWEHRYLAQTKVTGEALSDYSARTSVVLATNPSDEERADYCRRYQRLLLRLVDVVSTLHDEDIVFGDLSPHNVIVPDDVSQAQLIDFEGAIEVGGDDRARIATPGFVAPEQRAGHATKASDVYAIGAMGAALLFPVNAMCDMVPEARRRFMDAVVDDVGLPRGIVDLLQGLMAEEPDGRPRLAEVRQQLAEADWRVGRRVERRVEVPRLAELRDRALNFLEATWTPDRADRLVAADPRVFTTNPLSVAHGACGVARAFAYVTGKVPDVVVRYILAEAFDVAHYAPGLYIGLSGIAWTLLDLGERERAIHALRLAEHHQLRFSGHDVWHGEAGIGLAALRVHSVCGDGRALQMAIDSGEFLLKMARRESGSLNWAAGDVVPHGYAHGAAGVAEFLRQLGRATTDEMWLQAGVDALRFELHRAVTTRDEGWSWTYAADRPSAVLPYFEYGSAGVGAVAARFYSTTGLQEYRDALDRIRKDTARRFALQPGLAMGLSGLAEFLVDGFAVTGDPGWLSDLDKTLHGISLFAVEREEGVVFPGDRLQRLSCDYLTGNAGIAIALHRALTRGPRDLFL